MNERIQELAEQAHCYACEYAQRPDYNPHNPYNQLMYKQRYDSKFAELIAQDITSQVALLGVSNFENEDITWTVETVIKIVKNRYKNDTENCI